VEGKKYRIPFFVDTIDNLVLDPDLEDIEVGVNSSKWVNDKICEDRQKKERERFRRKLVLIIVSFCGLAGVVIGFLVGRLMER
jgi:hypothetical protein